MDFVCALVICVHFDTLYYRLRLDLRSECFHLKLPDDVGKLRKGFEFPFCYYMYHLGQMRINSFFLSHLMAKTLNTPCQTEKYKPTD
jgi:hypothetical protein